jgi:HNH endonuclease
MPRTRPRRRVRRAIDRRARRAISRPMMFGPGPALGIWAWHHAGNLFRFEGLAVLGVAGLLLWPLLVMAVLALLTVPHLLVPRGWRQRWRHAHGRAGARSSFIPAHMRKIVQAADRRRCLYCGSPVQPQIDHILPWAAGGRTWLWNLAVLCAVCNKVKSNYWYKTPHLYKPFPGFSNPVLAAEIEAAERLHRWNPGRWFRAAWELAA